MKKILGIVVALVVVLSSCKQTPEKVSLKTEKDSLSYIVGVYFASQVKTQSEIEDLNYDAIAKGFAEVFKADTFKMNPNEINMLLNKYLEKLHKKNGEKNKADGQKFLDENKKKSGIITTASGLQYQVIKEGTGPVPDSASIVSAHYVGTFVDGKEFESSIKMGQPAKFPVTGVIPGWTEALLKMKVGSKWKLFIPSNLAYGEAGRGKIKSNTALVFEIDLLGIEPAQPQTQPDEQISVRPNGK